MTTATMTKTNIMEDKAMERTIEAREMDFKARVQDEYKKNKLMINTQLAFFDKSIEENSIEITEGFDMFFHLLKSKIDRSINYIKDLATEMDVKDSESKKAVNEINKLKTFVKEARIKYLEKADKIYGKAFKKAFDKDYVKQIESTVAKAINKYKAIYKFSEESALKYNAENVVDTIQVIANSILGFNAFANEQVIIDITRRILEMDAVGMLSENLADNGEQLSGHGEVESQEAIDTIADDNSQTGSNPIADESSTYTAPVSVNRVPVVAHYQEGQILRSGSVVDNPVVAVPLKQGQDNNNGIPLPIDIS